MVSKKLLVLPLMLTSLCACAGPKAVSEDCGPTDGEVGKQIAVVAEITRKVAGGPCPDPSKLQGICNDVYKQFRIEDENSPYEYQYEQKIYEAACADPLKDTEEEARKKIQAMWNRSQDNLKCDKANFDVAYGNILKYAVRMQTYDLLDRAAQMWKVNLNVVDKTDGRTLLDYVKFELEQQKGQTQELPLKTYYQILRRNGAKHSSEL